MTSITLFARNNYTNITFLVGENETDNDLFEVGQ